MRVLPIVSLVLPAILGMPAWATSIPLDPDTTAAELQSGDELWFQIDLTSFERQAQWFGQSPLPDYLAFLFFSRPSTNLGSFDATLRSQNGGYSVDLPSSLDFEPGYVGGGPRPGAAAVLLGSMDFTAAQQQGLFDGSSFYLILRNVDGPVTLSFPPYSLHQDMQVALGSGPLAVGMNPSAVFLDPAAAVVPEPSEGLLLLGGGAILCVLARLRRRPHPSCRGRIK